tara:strand:- start:61 stop:4023 length:3963 start_codon:yes stop_codon:yes gene_type:complete
MARTPRKIGFSESPLYNDETYRRVYADFENTLNLPLSEITSSVDEQEKRKSTSYYDSQQEKIIEYTAADILGGGRYIAKETSGVPIEKGKEDEGVRVGTKSVQRALTDSQNYARLQTIEAIFRDNEKLQKVLTESGVSVEDLESLRDKETLDQYTAKLRSNAQLTSSDYSLRKQSESDSENMESSRSFGNFLKQTAPIGGTAIANYIVNPVSSFLFDSNEQERAELVYRGVAPEDVESYYMEGETFPAEFRARLSVSPLTMTAEEFTNVVRPFDPNAEVFQIDPRKGQVGKGLLIRSPKYTDNKLVRVGSVQPFEELIEGNFDPTIEFLANIGAQEGLEIAAGGFVVKLARDAATRKFKDRLSKAENKIDEVKLEDKDSKTSRLLSTGQDILLTSFGTATAESSSRLLRLATGKATGVQPELTFDRAIEDSGALFTATFLYGGLGDLFIRSAAKAWGLATGKPVPGELLDRIILQRQRQEDKVRGKTTVTGTPAESSREATQEIIDEFISEGSEQYNVDAIGLLQEQLKFKNLSISVRDRKSVLDETAREVAANINKGVSLGQASQDQIIQALEEQILISLAGSRTPGATQLQKYAENEANMLDNFYQKLADNLDIPPEKMPSKEQVNEIFTGIRTTQLEEKLSAEQQDLADSAADAAITNLTGKQSREAREAAASDVKESVVTNDMFPDRRSRILQFRDEEVKAAQNTLNEIKSREEFNDPDFAISIKKYIDVAVDDFLDANKNIGILGTTDAAEAAEIIRDIIPNNEAGGTSIRLLTPGQKRELIPDPNNPGKMIEGGKFLALKKWTVKEIQDTRENLYSLFKNHPNPVARQKGMAIVDGLDKAYEEQLRQMYRKTTGNTTIPFAERKDLEEIKMELGVSDYDEAFMGLEDAQRGSSGRFINDIINKPNSQIGDFVLTHNPDEVAALVSLLGQQPDGLKKLENIKSLVLKSIQEQVASPYAKAGGEAERFNTLMRKNEEQLRSLFPEEFVEFENFAGFMRTSEQAVKASKQNLAAIQKELDAVGVKNITDLLDNFFSLSIEGSQKFRGSSAEKPLLLISEIADQYPALRQAMQGYFQEEILGRLEGGLYRDAGPQFQRMSTASGPLSGFDFNSLQRMFGSPAYKTNQDLASALSVIVGKEQAPDYAKRLRTLATRINQQKGFLGSPLTKFNQIKNAESVSSSTQKAPRGKGDVAFIRKLVSGPLSHGNYALGLLSDFSDYQRAKYMAEIISDPRKLQAYIEAENRKLPLATMAKVVHALYMGREMNVGSEDREKEIDAIKRDAANLSKYSEDSAYEALLRIFNEGSTEAADIYQQAMP